MCLPFLPFLGFVIVNTLVSIKNDDSLASNVRHSWQHLPLFQPLAYAKQKQAHVSRLSEKENHCSNAANLRTLFCLDLDASYNSCKVEKILQHANLLCFFEAFLESSPQFILQLVIVFTLGHISRLSANN